VLAALQDAKNREKWTPRVSVSLLSEPSSWQQKLTKMGNQLVGIAPSQIFPVEHYLTDHSDLLFDVK